MERDDVIEYSLDAHHDEAHGKKVRATIWRVTGLLAAVTLIEVFVGAYWREWFGSEWWGATKLCFIILTLVKATYIVMTFMHLGDERRNIRAIILLPYALFIFYLVFIAIWESNYIEWMLNRFQ
jgi:cytochrome c oxidase subunit IV